MTVHRCELCYGYRRAEDVTIFYLKWVGDPGLDRPIELKRVSETWTCGARVVCRWCVQIVAQFLSREG